MTQLKETSWKSWVWKRSPPLGQTFDPNLHNAVMHVEDEEPGRERRGRGVPGRASSWATRSSGSAMVKVAN